jgi:lysophospholipase L1-like esterase
MNQSIRFTNGNVGICTTSPASRLHLANSSTAANIVFEAGSTADGGAANSGWAAINFNGYYDGNERRINTSKNRWRLVCDQRTTEDKMFLETFNGGGNTNLLTFTTGGNIGIGTYTPSYKLHIVDPSSSPFPLWIDGTGKTTNTGINLNAASGYISFINLHVNGTGPNIAGYANRLDITQSASQNTCINPNGGSVGIGTISPSHVFHVSASNLGDTIRIENTSSSSYASVQLKTPSQTFIVGVGGASEASVAYRDRLYMVHSNGAYGICMTTNGNVGIGTSAPSANLHVGGNGTIRATTITNSTGYVKFLPSAAHSRRIVIFGSSVAFGTGATSNQGWAYMLGQYLGTQGWTYTNVSIGGNTTTDLINRFYTDVVPLRPDVVIIGLSLANEGILNPTGKQTVFDGYIKNMFKLIDMCLQQGFKPIVTGTYPNNSYTSVEYNYIKQVNKVFQTSQVPYINFLGAVDDGTGKWRTGMFADGGHPNDIGHTALYRSIPLSLFDMLSYPEQNLNLGYPPESSIVMTNELSVNSPIEYTVGSEPFGSWTFMLNAKLRAGASTGIALMTVFNGTGAPLRVRAPTLVWEVATNTVLISSTIDPRDLADHQIVLTYDYHTDIVSFYIDGVLYGTSTTSGWGANPTLFTVLGRPDGLFVGNNIEISRIAVYKNALNIDEIKECYRGFYPKSNLEIFSPCIDNCISAGNSLLNLALTDAKFYINSNNLQSAYGVYSEVTNRQVTIDFSAHSNTIFYPVVIDQPSDTIDGTHYIDIEMINQGGSEAYNMHSMQATCRGGGWSDQTPKWDVYHNYFQTGERSILGIWRGNQNFYGVVVYLRGGKSYKLITRSRIVIPNTGATTFVSPALLTNGSTFALKNASGADVSGTSSQITEMVNLINLSAGRIMSDNLFVQGEVYATGDVIAFSSISDARLKMDVETISDESSIDVVKSLRPVSFTWMNTISNEQKRGTHDVGFIAQEVESSTHYAVDEFKDIKDQETYKRIKYERLVPYLVGSIKHLTAKLDEYKAELDDLRSRLN